MAVRLSTAYYPHPVFPNSLANANRFISYSSHLQLRPRPRPLMIPPPLRTFRFLAVTSARPPSHSDSDSDSDPDPPSGVVASKTSKLQDKVQIFLAVLFWMSLFFWASAWDGNNNNNNGRPDNKGSRSRR